MSRELWVPSSEVVVRSGWVGLVAGVLGLASAIFLLVVDPAVGDDRFNYPFTPDGFAAIQVFFFIHHLGMLAGLYGLWRSGAVGTSRLGRCGAWGAIAGMGFLAVTELVAISGSNSANPSAGTDMIGASTASPPY